MKWSPHTIRLDRKKTIRLDGYEQVGNRVIGILGGSGYGKSTLLQHLYSRHHGKGVAMGYMKQDILLHPDLTVYETLWFYAALRCGEEICQIETILQAMGMSHLSTCKVGRLSGGEKKRVMLAHHLLDEHSHYLLLDEPFSGIDPENRELLFALLLERKRTCSILITLHHIEPFLSQHLDEVWTLVPSPGGFRLATDLVGGSFSEIPLTPDDERPAHTPTTHPWRSLFLRDRLLDKKKRWSVFFRWLTPLIIVGLQQALIGSFPFYLRQWQKDKEMLTLMEMVLTHTLLMFTASISPMHMLDGHFQKRAITYHEMDQGLYRKHDYFFSAILWDQLSLFLSAWCIVLVLMPPDDLLLTTFLNVMVQMGTTNLLMWLCSHFRRSSFHTTLVLVSIYISIAFIGNLGLLLRVRPLDFLQHTSTLHAQSNLLLERAMVLFPEGADQLVFVLHCLNTHGRHGFLVWVVVSLGFWVGGAMLLAAACQWL